MLNTQFFEENAVPFLCGLGSSVVFFALFKLSKYCCC